MQHHILEESFRIKNKIHLKEAINLDDYEKTGRCRNKKDAVCVEKNKDASAIYALFPTRKLLFFLCNDKGAIYLAPLSLVW